VTLPLFVLWLYLALWFDPAGIGFGRLLAAHYLYGLAIVAYGVSLLLRRRLPRPTPLDLPLVGVLGAGALATALSPYRANVMETAVALAAVAVVFYALHDWELLTAESLIKVLLTVCSVLAVIALGWFVAGYLSDLELRRAVLGELTTGEMLPAWHRPTFFYHANVLAWVINLALPFALAIMLRPASVMERLVVSAAFSLCFLVLVLTNSRGGWLAFAVAVASFIILDRVNCSGLDLNRALAWGRQHKRRVAASLLGVTFVCVLAVSALWVVHPAWLFRETASSRLDIFHVAFEMVSARPLLGFGPNTFGFVQVSYGANTEFVTHPHNQYLYIAASFGLLGLLSAGAFAIAIGRVLIPALSQEDRRHRVLAVACAAGFLSILVHGLVDTPLNFAGSSVLVVVPLVIALRLSGPAPAPALKRSLIPAALVLTIAPACLLFWQSTDSAHSHFDQSIRMVQQGQLAAALESAEQAVDAAPESIAYQVHAGILNALAHQRQLSSGPAAQSDPLVNAIAHLERATELDPRSYLAYANLAQALRLKGDEAGASNAALRALSMVPREPSISYVSRDPTIAAAAGTVLEWSGHSQEAVRAYAVALRMDPSLTQSPFWFESPAREDLRRQAITLSGITPCQWGRNAALYGAYGDDLAALTQACSDAAPGPEDRAALAIMLEAQGLHAEAVDAARAASSTAEGHAALGYVMAAADVESARRELLAAHFAGDREAILLLSLTYHTSVSPASGLIQPASWPPAVQPLPSEVLERLEDSIRTPRSWLSVFAYNGLYRRTSLEVMLIPGEWEELRSPRDVVTKAIVEAGGANGPAFAD
jgi:O-antigen ligase/tetratricopeptide (TPR) repeat protein